MRDHVNTEALPVDCCGNLNGHCGVMQMLLQSRAGRRAGAQRFGKNLRYTIGPAETMLYFVFAAAGRGGNVFHIVFLHQRMVGFVIGIHRI